MLTGKMLEIKALQDELAAVVQGKHLATARAAWREPLDSLRPVEEITTNEVANKYMYRQTEGGGEAKFYTSQIPYVEGIHDALDDPTIRMVLVKGPARSVKTTAAEAHLLKIGKFGPSQNVLWYMHSTGDLEDYVEERGEFLIMRHFPNKVGKKSRDNSRLRKRVDGATWRWLAANKSTTRGKAAPYIVADEIDAMRKDIRRSIDTLIRNRQREFGNRAKAYIASHSDEGPNDGIDKLLVDSDLRVRMWRCKDCSGLASPAVEAPAGRRIVWNVPDLMAKAEEMERDAFLNYVAANVHLTCPHCRARIDNEARLELDQTGEWFARGQEIALVDGVEQIVGERIRTDTAGFVIHAFMSSLVKLSELAKEWAAARLTYDQTGDFTKLKEVSVKSLGETYRTDEAASKRRRWQDMRAKMVDTYRHGTVPAGVDFLTGMVDVQGDRFEAGVIGWSRYAESWLIGRYPLRQILRPGHEALSDVSPGTMLGDWDMIESFLHRTFPLADGSGRRMMIAKLGVDTGGVPGVTNNARVWAANIMSRRINPVPSWRIALLHGHGQLKPEKPGQPRRKGEEMYSRPIAIDKDDALRPLPVTIIERTVDTDLAKTIVASRFEIENPGPYFMHLPSNVEDKHIRELFAEAYENGMWVSSGRNETWDIWVGAEVCRSLLAPDSHEIDWDSPPEWASAFLPDEEDDSEAPRARSFAERLVALNRGDRE